MAAKIILKKSALASAVPSAATLEPGELAINLADRTLYSKDTGGTVFSLVAGGSYSNAEVDAHLNTAAATEGQVLSWDGADYAWVAAAVGTAVARTVDGGASSTVFLSSQTIDGGLAASTYTSDQTINGGGADG